MSFHDRIKKIRQEHGWTQAELAKKVGIQQKQISAYESGTNYPATDILIRLAETLDVSLDYLAFEHQGQTAKIQVKDRELLRFFETIDNYDDEEKNTIKEILNLVVVKHKVRELATSH